MKRIKVWMGWTPEEWVKILIILGVVMVILCVGLEAVARGRGMV